MTQPGGDLSHAAAAGEPLLLGKLVSGKYKVLSLIATGGMGRIYRAEQIPLGRVVALKTLISAAIRKPQASDPTTPSSAQFKQRFFREASVLSKLQHPNVVTVFDYGRIDGVPGSDDEYYMAMEFLAGETLLERLSSRGRFSAAETAEYVRQTAMGLRAAHAMGVVHRDLKPSNLMLVKGPEGQEMVKVLDFGIIKLLNEESQELTQEGVFVGSPRYMAPEQIVANTIDTRADIYSLGVIAYQMLTGQTPFNGETAVQTMMAHVNSPVPPMRSVYRDLDAPEWLEQLVERCLEKDPAARPSGMDEILDELRGEQAQGPASLSLRAEPASGSKGISRIGDGPLKPETPNTPTVSEAKEQQASVARRRGGVRSAAVALVAGMLVLASVVLLSRERKVTRSTSAPQTATTGSSVETYDLLIDSTPRGAFVRESDQVLGNTPLDVQVSNRAVRDVPRTFTLSLDGHKDRQVIQGASDRPVRVQAVLEPDTPPVASASAVAGASATPPRGTRAPRSTTAAAAAPPAAAPPAPRPLEIETTR